MPNSDLIAATGNYSFVILNTKMLFVAYDGKELENGCILAKYIEENVDD